MKEDVVEWEVRPGHNCHSRLYREGTSESEGGEENSTSWSVTQSQNIITRRLLALPTSWLRLLRPLAAQVV